MKYLVSFIAVVMLLTNNGHSLTAQEKIAAGKLIYGEIGGPGVVMSANFDSRFILNTRTGLGYRVGLGVINYSVIEGETDNDNFFQEIFKQFSKANYTLPIGLNYVFGRANTSSLSEIGAGITCLMRKMSLYNWGVEKPGYFLGHLAFMYRITPLNNGFSFRGGFTPMIGTGGNFFPMGAVSFGYAF